AAKVAELREKRAKSGSQGGRRKAENARARAEANSKQTSSNLLDAGGIAKPRKVVTERSQLLSNKHGDDASNRPVTLVSEPDKTSNVAGQSDVTSSNLLADCYHAAVAKSYPETETDTEEVLRTSTVPPSAGTASPRRAKSPDQEPNAGSVVGAWVEAATAATGERPANRLIAQVGRYAKELLAEGKDPNRLIEAAKSAGHKGY